jgi:hypothetical protein
MEETGGNSEGWSWVLGLGLCILYFVLGAWFFIPFALKSTLALQRNHEAQSTKHKIQRPKAQDQRPEATLSYADPTRKNSGC